MNGPALLVSIPEAGRLLGISRSHLYNMIGDGRLHPLRIGRSVRLRVAELEALIVELAAVAHEEAQSSAGIVAGAAGYWGNAPMRVDHPATAGAAEWPSGYGRMLRRQAARRQMRAAARAKREGGQTR